MKPKWWFIIGCLLILSLPILRNNLANVRVLQSLEVSNRIENAEELAWNKGWEGLCSGSTTAQNVQTANLFAAQANIDLGDFVTAEAQFEALSQENELAQAYWLALNMDWLAAVEHYPEPSSARHRRFWATVFYLAAQQAMFAGDGVNATRLYGQADADYGAYGPFAGLGLVSCLEESGRVLEAFDVYRRSLVTLPPAQALAHQSQFARLRLAALQRWQQQQPNSAQIARWLELFTRPEQIPVVSVPLTIPLTNGRQLQALDYRPEEIETGPFMTIDFHICHQTTCHITSKVVLNQAPNGAFLWDDVPDAIRPTGWHTLIYSPDLGAIEYGPNHVLCLNSDLISASFGLQGKIVPLEGGLYVQGATGWAENGGAFTAGRAWFTGDYAYSYIATIFPGPIANPVGTWPVPAGTSTAAVWLIGQATGRVCLTQLYFFALPDL